MGSVSTAYEPAKLTGYVVKLAEQTKSAPVPSANVGGLVIVVIRDSGSRPPQDISVAAPEVLQPLGVVRGVQNDEGVALMGGGYTWHLFTPTTKGEAVVNVAYTENGDDGKRVERDCKLTIE
jgi:hypothetical protein